ncbi:bifunctional DNA primase/polymerase [Streptomyces sp. NBC_01455]|uniref:bifunctional DNA primase/polymerase n=1 Tax=Streptomyces sp. NBC_01455 TaxID=2903874 RepID=UPI002E31132D|nr:bifunctional DNA primase/polymerase [Streptomyces sp. NBC_01455]
MADDSPHAEWRFDMLSIAHWCAAQGWPVLPLASGRKAPAGNCPRCQEKGHTHVNCFCLAAGRWCHSFHAATTKTERIDAWWSDNPQFGVGVACGAAGLVVLDIDTHSKALPTRDRILPGIAIHDHVELEGLEHGFHTLALLAALRGETDPAQDEETLRVRTPSGGLHVWYRADDRRRFRCSTGSGAGRALAWQVDIRAGGGYIVAPGTTTDSGTYMPVGNTRTPRRLPEWLAVELTRTGHLDLPQQRSEPRLLALPQRARQAVIAAGGSRGRAAQILESVLREVIACAAVSEGTGFSDKLNRAAYTAGGLAAGGYVSTADVERVLRGAADYARPGQERRSTQIIRSGLDAGARRPLHIEGHPA